MYSEAVAEDEKKSCGGDTAVFGPPLPDGGIPYIRHREDHTITQGVAHVLRDGQPVDPRTEIVRLDPDEGYRYRVTSIYEGAASKGPSKITTDAYRSGWDQIFGKKAPVGEA